MVEYKVRVDPKKETVLDAHNPDLWGDPVSTNKQLQVGGVEFPKLGLFSFDIPQPPRFGGGVFKSAELVFNTEDIVSDISSQDVTVETPSLEVYKMKNEGTIGGIDWEGTGDISVVTKAIHQVSGDNADFASIREDFSGRIYREGNEDYIPASRHQTVKVDIPYMTKQQVTEAINDELFFTESKSDPDSNATVGTYMEDYATAAEGLIGQKVIHLQSHKTNSDGTGWWRTKLRDGSEDRKSARYIRKRSYMDNPGSYISWGHQIPVTTELYGDEVTPENSIFYLVAGDREYSETVGDGGDSTLYGTGAVRFSTKKKLTGTQSMNMFCYWRAGEANLYDSDVDVSIANAKTHTPKHVQQAMVAYKNLPFPEPILSHLYPKPQPTSNHSYQDFRDDRIEAHPRLKMSVNFEHLEMAHSYELDANQDYHTHRRGFFILFSNVKPKSGESLNTYLERVTDYTVADGEEIDDNDSAMNTANHTLAGVFFRNSNLGIRMSDIGGLRYEETSNNGPYWMNLWGSHDGDSPMKDGTGQGRVAADWNEILDSTSDGVPDESLNITAMNENEWYEFNFMFSPRQDEIFLNISDSDGNPVHQAYTPHCTDNSMFPLGIQGCNTAMRHAKNSTQYSEDWPAHMSIWVTNYPHGYSAGSYAGTDWMIDNSGTLHDTMQSIYIDNIEYMGVNLNHSNATPSVNNKTSLGRLTFNADKEVKATMVGRTSSHSDGIHNDLDGNDIYSDAVATANWTMAFGTESATDWSGGTSATDTNHRYLYFQDFQHPNKSIPRPIGNSDDYYPTGAHGHNVFSVGISRLNDWLGRGGTSYLSTQWHNLARMTTADRIDEDHGGFLKDLDTAESDKTYAQFQYWGRGDSDYDNSEDELDDGKGSQFYVNGFTQKGFVKLAIDAETAISGAFQDGDVSTGSDTIDLDVAPPVGEGLFSYSGYHVEGASWKPGVEDNDEIYFASFDNSNFDDGKGNLPGGLTQGTKYYADYQSGRQIKVLSSSGGSTVNITTQGDASDFMVMMGGKGVKHSRTESIFSSAKILEVVSGVSNPTPHGAVTLGHGGKTKTQDMILRVDTTTPLRSFANTRYIVYIRDAPRRIGTPDNDVAGTISPGYQDAAKTELEIEIISGTLIRVKRWNGLCDQGSKYLLADAEEDVGHGVNITRAYISPLKYWLWMVGAVEGNDSNSFTSSSIIENNVDTEGVRHGFTRSYGSVVLCKQFTDAGGTARSALGVIGASYNEWQTNFKTVNNIAAPRINSWDHSLSEIPQRTTLDLKDYGLGPLKKEDDGSYTGGLAGASRIQPKKTNSISLGNLPVVENYTGGETLSLLVRQPLQQTIPKTVNISSSDTTDFERPHLLAIYEDELPEISKFKVQPSEEDAYNPHFTWECKGDDLWYGFIVVDNEPIEHQYHGSVFHCPLDEDFSDHYELLDYTYGFRNSNMHNNTNKVVPLGYRYYTTAPCKVDGSLQARATTDYGKNLRVDSTGYSGLETGVVAADSFRVFDTYGLAGRAKNFSGDKSGYDYTTGDYTLLGTNMWEPSGTTGWTAGTGWTVASSAFRYTKASADMAKLVQTGFTLEAGNLYQITFDCATAGLYMAITDSTGKYRVMNSSGKGTAKNDTDPFETMEKNNDDSFDETVKYAMNVTTTDGIFRNLFDGTTSYDSGNGTHWGNDAFFYWPAGTKAGHSEHKIYIMPTTDWEGIAFTAISRSTSATHDINRMTILKMQNSNFISWKNYEGLALDTTNKAVQQTGNTFAAASTELSVIAHVTPDAWAPSNIHSNWIVSQSYGKTLSDDGDSTNGPGTNTSDVSWGLFIDNDGKINGYAASLISPYDGLANASANNNYLVTSKTLAPTDGTPINVIMTIDTELLHGNVKLFINGKLEDSTGAMETTYSTSGGRNAGGWDAQRVSTSGYIGVNRGQSGEPIHVDNATWSSSGHEHYFSIGCLSPSFAWYSEASNLDYHFHRETGGTTTPNYNSGNRVVGGFSGKIEEVVVYNKVIYPVDPALGEFTLTKPLPEVSYDRNFNVSSPLTWNAKLFVKDYHNIRGRSPEEVAQSPNISWAKTSFPLFTKDNMADVT